MKKRKREEGREFVVCPRKKKKVGAYGRASTANKTCDILITVSPIMPNGPVSLKHDGPMGQTTGQRGSDPSALLQAN